MNKKNQILIGNGFIGQKFKKNIKLIKAKNITIYTAGVSNSLEKDKKEFQKEISRFKNIIKLNKNKLIYISTNSILDIQRSKSMYVKNKIYIESIIKKKFSKYLIIRFPEIVGHSKNENTLTNFFYKKIVNNLFFYVYKNTKRNLIDIDDAIKMSIQLINNQTKNKKIVNILNKKYLTPETIVKEFENLLMKKANFKFIEINSFQKKSKNNFYLNTSKNYLKKILIKYYKN